MAVAYRLTLQAVSGHYGLRGMRERLEGLGGTLTLHSNGQRGTLVEACLPIIAVSRQS